MPGANTGLARLTATNGDVYEVQFAVLALRVETSFGKTELPVKLIRSIKVSAMGNAGQWSSGLVARWTGDGNAKDSAGHFDGQVSGGLRYVPGPAGQAFQFNGGESQVDFGSSAGNFGTNDFTIAYWMKTDSRNPKEAFIGEEGGVRWGVLLLGDSSRRRRADPPRAFFTCDFDGRQQGSLYLISSHPINDGQWHHIAWVRQSAGSGSVHLALIYVDGALDNSKTFRRRLTLPIKRLWSWGRTSASAATAAGAYSGAAADLQLFSQALSAEEILAVYNGGKSGR